MASRQQNIVQDCNQMMISQDEIKKKYYYIINY